MLALSLCTEPLQRKNFVPVQIFMFLKCQGKQIVWTNQNPKGVHYFDTVSDASVLASWKIYLNYYAWYYTSLTQETRDGLMLTEVNLLKDILPTMDVNFDITKIQTVLMKLHSVDSCINAHLNTNESKDCAMMMVWNTHYLHWLWIPCNKQILDKATLFCVNNTAKAALQKSAHNKDNTTKITEQALREHFRDIQISNIFVCTDKSILSVESICDGHKDCQNGEDEIICSENSTGISVADLLKSTLDLKYYSNNSLESSFIDNDFDFYNTQGVISSDSQELFDCSATKVKCVYDIFHKIENRMVKYCENGSHLDDCKNNTCVNMYKCPRYYCLRWLVGLPKWI